MSRNEVKIDASVEQVFAVLADGNTYAEWVVGAKDIRDVDAGWPAPGSRIHHSVGAGPVHIDDVTEVLEVDPPRRLVLLAKVGPAGEARISLELASDGDGTTVTMDEEPVSGVMEKLDGPVTDAALHVRNIEALRRLKAHVEDG